jgi:hypothetical protein
MTFGSSFRAMLQRSGYSLVSEFLTTHGRAAVRVRIHASEEIVSMFHSDAVELARGATTAAAVVRRNRSVVFGQDVQPRDGSAAGSGASVRR